MRKIRNHYDDEKRKKRNSLIIGIFMLALLLLGTIGYGFSGFSGSQETPQGVQNTNLRNSKESVSSIPVEITKTLGDFIGGIWYISSDNQEATAEIVYNLGTYPQRIQPACYGVCEEDLPEKDCSENLIVFRNSDENKVYQEQNCIFIEGDLKAADAFVYKILEPY